MDRQCRRLTADVAFDRANSSAETHTAALRLRQSLPAPQLRAAHIM